VVNERGLLRVTGSPNLRKVPIMLSEFSEMHRWNLIDPEPDSH
jgi:hypothetical protein